MYFEKILDKDKVVVCPSSRFLYFNITRSGKSNNRKVVTNRQKQDCRIFKLQKNKCITGAQPRGVEGGGGLPLPTQLKQNQFELNYLRPPMSIFYQHSHATLKYCSNVINESGHKLGSMQWDIGASLILCRINKSCKPL